MISSASGLVIAVTVGLSLGMRRLPWRFLLVTFGIIGFLNQGKFVMREKYWDAESNTTGLGLLELPGLYFEWASASSSIFWVRAKSLSVMPPAEWVLSLTHTLPQVTDRSAWW